jgi:hypothetical protein
MVSGGEQSGYGILTVREQLWMFAQFYGVPSRVAHKRIDELLEAVDLADQANQKIYALSTGMRQRINLCRALVSDPEILFLDEPTVGLDVEAARVVRNYVRSWMQHWSCSFLSGRRGHLPSLNGGPRSRAASLSQVAIGENNTDDTRHIVKENIDLANVSYRRLAGVASTGQLDEALALLALHSRQAVDCRARAGLHVLGHQRLSYA